MFNSDFFSGSSKAGKYRGMPPTAMVIFGASGDLTQRKLMPALYNLAKQELLPDQFYLIGVGRKEMTQDAFEELMKQGVRDFSRNPLEEEVWGRIAAKISYHTGNYDDLESFKRLATKIDDLEKKIGRSLQPLFYISTPPNVFKPILENLGASGLARKHLLTPLCSKVVIEKPFGYDLDSALDLNRCVRSQFDEYQVYRIDHYLGKETVQDLLVLRFSNSILEPLWNRRHISYIEVTVAETLGVGSRGGYYDKSGALRDMIQNHAMQLLALIAMEPPVALAPESIRDEKVKVLKAIQPISLEGNRIAAVRGQYTAGNIQGEAVKGYLEEEGIPQNSMTETFAAFRLWINNWRWEGVPFYIRSGKRLARRVSEIVVKFRKPPGVLFRDNPHYELASNRLSIQIQPNESVTLLLNSKEPGLQTQTQPVEMNFKYAPAYGSNTPEAYERLLIDSMIGDNTLFIRSDETETSWDLYTPVLDFWKNEGNKNLETYTAGSWGPKGSQDLLWEGSHRWYTNHSEDK